MDDPQSTGGLKSARRGLHVQSRSYWAPANIGPYAQAVRVPMAGGDDTHALVHVAGQIPLVPASMDPLANSAVSGRRLFLRQALLAAQHLWRIGREMGVGWWSGGVAFLAANAASPARAKLAAQIWEALHALPPTVEVSDLDEGGPDLWDRRYGGQGTFAADEEPVQELPDFANFAASTAWPQVPGFLAVEVQETPRGCAIEWQGLFGLASGSLASCSLPGLTTITATLGEGRDVAVQVYEFGREEMVEKVLRRHGCVRQGGQGSVESMQHAILYTTRPEQHPAVAAQLVPCRRIWGRRGQQIVGGLVVLAET